MKNTRTLDVIRYLEEEVAIGALPRGLGFDEWPFKTHKVRYLEELLMIKDRILQEGKMEHNFRQQTFKKSCGNCMYYTNSGRLHEDRPIYICPFHKNIDDIRADCICDRWYDSSSEWKISRSSK